MLPATSVDEIEDFSEFYRPDPDPAIIEFILNNPGCGTRDIAKAVSLSRLATTQRCSKLRLAGRLRFERQRYGKYCFYVVP
jgi:predicted transcriptional regulator